LSGEEGRDVRRLVPHLAEGIRAGLLASSLEDSDVADAPGLVLVTPDGSFISTTAAGERWLDELGHAEPARCGLPVEVHLLAARLGDVGRCSMPRGCPPRGRRRSR
jgi:hypothetical protein